MILKEVCRQFLEHCGSTSNLSLHTMRAYCSDLDEAQRYFGFRRQMDVLKKEPLRQYIHYMREDRQLKETTIKRRLASLKLLFKWAMLEKFVTENPFDSLNERIRLPKRLPRALDRADQAALRNAVTLEPKNDGFIAVRDKTAIHFLLDTGIRVGELVAIELADISLADRSVVIHGKGNRQRLVYLPQRGLVQKIKQYLAWRSSLPTYSEKLFIDGNGAPISSPKVRTSLRDLAKAAGISRHVTPHMLRHTCATQWLESGLDIRYVQRLLGHHSISTTEIYTHVSDQGLREALAKVWEGRKR